MSRRLFCPLAPASPGPGLLGAMRPGCRRQLKPLRFFLHITKFIRAGIVKGDETWKRAGTGCVQQRKEDLRFRKETSVAGEGSSPKPEAGSNA